MNGQSCQWTIIVTAYAYKLSLIRANASIDSLSFEALDAHSVLHANYSESVDLSPGNWFKLNYTQIAENTTNPLGLTFHFTNITDPSYIPPVVDPPVVVNPPVVVDPPVIVPTTTQTGGSTPVALIVGILIPLLLIGLIVTLLVMLVRRRRRAKKIMSAGCCSDSGDKVSLSNIRSFTPTRGGDEATLDFPIERGSLNYSCDPIKEQEGEEYDTSSEEDSKEEEMCEQDREEGGRSPEMVERYREEAVEDRIFIKVVSPRGQKSSSSVVSKKKKKKKSLRQKAEELTLSVGPW